MSESGTYGKRLARHYSESYRPLVSRTSRKSVDGPAKTRSDHPAHAASNPMPPEDAFLIALQLRDLSDHKYSEDGRQTPLSSRWKGCTTVTIADGANPPHIEDLRNELGKGGDDPIVRALTSALGLTLEQPDRTKRLFVVCIMLALRCHATQTYNALKE